MADKKDTEIIVEPDDIKSIGKDLLEYLYHTEEKHMPEMTVLRQRLIHGLTTMQAWEKEFMEMVTQIRSYQAWFCLQRTRIVVVKEPETNNTLETEVEIPLPKYYKLLKIQGVVPLKKKVLVMQHSNAKYEYKYDLDKAKKMLEKMIENDKVDMNKMFSHSWRQSLYQHARSEEGKHLEGARQLEEGIIATQQAEPADTWGRDQ